MKIIILKEVNGLKPGEIKEVSNGYAKNFLIKNGFAKPATEVNIKLLETEIAKLKKIEEEKIIALQKEAEKIDGLVIEIKVKTGEDNKIFGSITSKNIAQAIIEKGYMIDKKNISAENIKEIGDHSIEIKFGNNISSTITVKVIKEK